VNTALATGARAVLDFWFGEPPASEPRAEWFRKDAVFDAQIRTRFGTAIEQALSGGLRHWADAAQAAEAAEGALARILLLDQFTRNAWRDTPRAFAGDALALSAAKALVASGQHLALAPLQRWFAYLPFEHAEDAGMQAESLRLFAALATAHPALAEAHAWAVRHAEVITRFGRYPHRNLVLGRLSTPEEIAYLAQPGSGF
jgi:uncharacterized protein (DUF924 family)